MFDGKTQSLFDACVDKINQRAFFNAYRKTFCVVLADTDELRKKVFRLRHRVYCVENLYINPRSFPDELERDAFDERAWHWLMIHKETGESAGTLRLLMPDADRPLVSFELQKACDHPLLQIENRVLGVCEISRFCMAHEFRRRLLDGSLLPSYHDQEDGGKTQDDRKHIRLIPYAPLGLLGAAFDAAIEHGLHSCVMTIEPRQVESFKNLGLVAHTLGPSIILHGPQQPVILNIKAVLDNMAQVNRACWDVLTDRGALQRRVDESFRKSWQDTAAGESRHP